MGSLSVKKCLLRPLDGLRRKERSVALLLNGNCTWSSLWKTIWNKAVYRVCTDGAGNGLEPLIREERVKQPHLLCGDFDSITESAFCFFKSSGICIQPTPDQNYTDMFKALMLVAKEIKQKRVTADRVLVLGGLSGRIDHTLSSFQSLLLFRSICDCPIYLIDGVNLVTVLTEGISELRFDDSLSLTTGTAGFIPFCQRRTIVSSEGFRWDLKKMLMEFGGCISTSNKIEKETVTIESTAPLIFTLELSPQCLDT